jgi:hypothetical protein
LRFLDIAVAGDTASISYGARVKEIARRWAVDLREPAESAS